MSDRIDVEQVREVVRLAEELRVAELEVETATLKVRVKLAGPGQLPAAADAARVSLTSGAAGIMPASAPTGEARGADHLEAVVAPMVGTFYRAPSPDAPPFVKEGDFVEESQVVCIIEAMKLFNEIQAEKRGRIAQVLLENATPVEFGQPLFLVDTSAVRG
jgi:acetyl-CoA carboxylase biotin carboxyl carrier protein